jgi:hypothetical protein
MVVKRGKRIGSWTSNECNSWLNGYLPSRSGATLAAAKLTMSLTTSSSWLEYAKGFPQEHLMSAGQLLLNRDVTNYGSSGRCLLTPLVRKFSISEMAS